MTNSLTWLTMSLQFTEQHITILRTMAVSNNFSLFSTVDHNFITSCICYHDSLSYGIADNNMNCLKQIQIAVSCMTTNNRKHKNCTCCQWNNVFILNSQWQHVRACLPEFSGHPVLQVPVSRLKCYGDCIYCSTLKFAEQVAWKYLKHSICCNI